ncbi:Helicase associated domain protein [Streptomyces ovatisporus]|uniref:Helicase associated domain protein n=1 Tax=Streptomyces ovatisporus TaxID=1128682 RepID=A0ABV9ADB6_9ACTN
MQLRPHQREAVDAVVRALEFPATTMLPERGLRTQVIMATGSGKTLVAARSAEELRAGRVLVLVPSLDLLEQSVEAWRAGGRRGPVVGVSSLRGGESSFPSTTDVDELVAWTSHQEKVTVFATYASLGLGTLERAHRRGLPGWDLVVVDEAHRTSGRLGKPWAVIHDNARIPAERRLYMTATPRLWQLGEEEGEGAGQPGELVASMEDDPGSAFGARCYTLTLSQAVDRGIVAPYQVVCVDVTDTDFQTALLLGERATTDKVRGARLAALQAALVKASGEEGLRHTLVFHHKLKEAEAFAAGLPQVAAQLHRSDPELYPKTIWADWLSGGHRPAHRKRVLGRFSDGVAGDGTVVEKAFLSSVKVLGEGVDTATCDSVYWADVRGSMPDLVQAVGRALRMQPGAGKTASLVVPVLLGPGESPQNMLTSRAYAGLARLLAALRAHDARVVEALAEQQAPSRPASSVGEEPAGGRADAGWARSGQTVSGPARSLLKFSTHRDHAALAAFISLRVLRPDNQHWRRGIEAAGLYREIHGDLRVPFTYRVPAGMEAGAQGWPASLAAFPLGQWIADARRAYGQSRLDEDRIARLEELDMVWSHFDVAFEEGLDAARAWAAEHGHLLAPVDAVGVGGYPVGTWLRNQRAAAKRAEEVAQRRAEGLPRGSTAGVLTEARREALEEIDPAWCPAWPVDWQRCFHHARRLLTDGGTLLTAPGTLIVQGDDLGRWTRSQQAGWDKLSSAQQWLLQHILGIQPVAENKRKPRRNRAQIWAENLTATRQYRAREGNLNVPRSHVETITTATGQKREIHLGVFLSNQRSRAAGLPPEHATALSELGMRWT